jgi:hypothetical protein
MQTNTVGPKQQKNINTELQNKYQILMLKHKGY